MAKTNDIAKRYVLRQYITGCLESHELIEVKKWHENEEFINEVIDVYESNLDCTCDEYSEINAKDDAIEEVFKKWQTNYITSCLKEHENIVEKGLHENEEFINEVIDAYESNLYGICDEYSEINAKDEAIEEVFEEWQVNS